MIIKQVPYQERWPGEFREIGGRLRRALGGLALRIDHIGSTSVPGLAAKDVIDIQVTVAALAPVEPLIEAFAAAGCQMYGDIRTDHRPPGDESPDSDWEKRLFGPVPGGRPSHMHVRVEGRANQRYALLFRDFLRADPRASGGYERVKRELARLHPHDIDDYLSVKDPVCDIVMAAAEAYARFTGWKLGPSDA